MVRLPSSECGTISNVNPRAAPNDTPVPVCAKAIKSCEELEGKDCSGCYGEMVRTTDVDNCCLGQCLG